MCDAVGQGPNWEEVLCIVDWPHTIHCGYVGTVRCRWTDSGERPSADELRAWDEAFAARMAAREPVQEEHPEATPRQPWSW